MQGAELVGALFTIQVRKVTQAYAMSQVNN
jgi:hypothetical protein